MSNKPFWQKFFLPFISGAIAPLALSPYQIWPLGILSVLGLYSLLLNSSPATAAKIGWSYGFGFFGVGISWLYVSIKVYGNASSLFAGFLILLFVMALALLFAGQCWLFKRYFNKAYQLLAFAGLWILFEWLRSWLLTGFPWLYLGYAHLNTPISGFAPVFGVLGLSFVVVISGSILAQLLVGIRTNNIARDKALLPSITLLALWLVPLFLTTIQWTEEQFDKAINIGLVQANIDQSEKFDSAYLQRNFDLYQELTQPLWRNDIVFWPETAIPMDLTQAANIIEYYQSIAKENNSSLVSGIFTREDDKIYNSIISIGNGEGLYHKQKLVPFGEYIPLATITSNLLQIFNLPLSGLYPGPSEQSPVLLAAGLTLAPFICYEVVYPDFVRKNSINADFLVTISNDSWFGSSFGPLQHLEMAAMRALENGRYMVRATSNGVSAIIDEKGQIISRTRQFTTEVLSGQVKIFTGRTPFSFWGSYPLLFFCIVSLFLIFFLSSSPPSTTDKSHSTVS